MKQANKCPKTSHRKTKDWATRTPLRSGSDLRYSRMVTPVVIQTPYLRRRKYCYCLKIHQWGNWTRTTFS